MSNRSQLAHWTCEIGFIDESKRYGTPANRSLGTWPIPSVLLDGGSALSLQGIAVEHAEYLSKQCPDGWLYFRILNPSGDAVDVRYAAVTGLGIYTNDTLTLPVEAPPHPGLDQVWLIWQSGLPKTTGLWRILPADALSYWSTFCVSNQPECQPPLQHVVQGPVATLTNSTVHWAKRFAAPAATTVQKRSCSMATLRAA